MFLKIDVRVIFSTGMLAMQKAYIIVSRYLCMASLKGTYLKKLTSRMSIKSVEIEKELEGSTPPSVFIGSWNYPKVLVGPMIAPIHGDCAIMDTPEDWIAGQKTTEEIVGFRLNLVRGKQEVRVSDLDNKLVEKLRDISLASKSIESEAIFRNTPSGASLSEEHLPHGPSAMLKSFEIENCTWNHSMEKVYYDTDLKASEAIVNLYESGLNLSAIQKAFSVGTMGLKKNRKLVPTRWSITASDITLANYLLEEVKYYEIIENYRVYEFASLCNYYAVILIPTVWQYEWIEAFLHVLGNEELVFSDYETNRGKKEYSSVGGCYYSSKFAVLEALKREKKQAGAIVLREAYNGYIPLGVFNVRENVRHAMKQKPNEFWSFKAALAYVQKKLKLRISRFMEESFLLREVLGGKQTTLF